MRDSLYFWLLTVGEIGAGKFAQDAPRGQLVFTVSIEQSPSAGDEL